MRWAASLGFFMAAATSWAPAADAASVSKTYHYFPVDGATLSEIERDLTRRGPKLNKSGATHPGATSLEFKSRVTYGERNGRCGVIDASVTVKAEITLPRWTRNRRADADTRLIWDTLAADIKRHEEFHVVIAKNHARELEQALKGIMGLRGCQLAQEEVQRRTAELLARHDREQERFDRVESINFSDRLARLIQYRAQRMKDGSGG